MTDVFGAALGPQTTAWSDTFTDMGLTIPAGANVTHVLVHSQASGARVRPKIIREISTTSHEIVHNDPVEYTHPGGGYAPFLLSTPFVGPQTGVYRPAAYVSQGTVTRAVDHNRGAVLGVDAPPGVASFQVLVHGGPCFGYRTDGEAPPSPPPPPQSSGRVVIATVPAQSNEGVFMAGNGRLKMLEILQAAWPNKTFVTVHNGANSLMMAAWQPGQPYFEAAVTRTLAELQPGDTLVTIGFQGEGGDASTEATALAYFDGLVNCVQTFRSRMPAGYATSLHVQTLSFNIGPGWPWQRLVQLAQEKFGADPYRNNVLVRMSDIGTPDGENGIIVPQHPGDAVLVTAGERIGKAIAARLK